MLDPALYGEVRKLAMQGASQRETAAMPGISRATVAKCRKGAHIPGIRGPRPPKGAAVRPSDVDALVESMAAVRARLPAMFPPGGMGGGDHA